VTIYTTEDSLSADSSFSEGIQQLYSMVVTRETKQVLKQPSFVLAIIVIRAQAIVYHFALIDDCFVAMRQFHAGISVVM
jgi:hypothetical protein